MGLRADIASAQTEERRIFLAERQESPTQSLQGRWGMAFLLPITNLSGVASTEILDDVSILPYYAYQVAWIQEVLESDKVELGELDTMPYCAFCGTQVAPNTPHLPRIGFGVGGVGVLMYLVTLVGILAER